MIKKCIFVFIMVTGLGYVFGAKAGDNMDAEIVEVKIEPLGHEEQQILDETAWKDFSAAQKAVIAGDYREARVLLSRIVRDLRINSDLRTRALVGLASMDRFGQGTDDKKPNPQAARRRLNEVLADDSGATEEIRARARDILAYMNESGQSTRPKRPATEMSQVQQQRPPATTAARFKRRGTEQQESRLLGSGGLPSQQPFGPQLPDADAMYQELQILRKRIAQAEEQETEEEEEVFFEPPIATRRKRPTTQVEASPSEQVSTRRRSTRKKRPKVR